MSIKQVTENGKKFYRVYIAQTSKKPGVNRIQKKGKASTRRDAERIERELIAQVTTERLRREGKGVEFKSIVMDWYNANYMDEDRRIGKETLQDYLAICENWYSHLFKREASGIKISDIKQVINRATKEGRSKSFQQKLKNVINVIYKWAIEEGVIFDINNSPAKSISINRKEEKKPEILTSQEASRFLELARNCQHPWYPVWATALLTGCRSGELIALTWDDIDLEAKMITVSKSYNTRRKETKSTKAGYYRSVPINEDLEKLLIELKNKATCKNVLPQFSAWRKGYQAKVLRGFLELHGLPSVKFHTLRACFATMLLSHSIAPIKVMKVCGWRDLDTMARYVRLAGLDEKGVTDKLKLIPSTAGANILSLA